MNMQMEVGLGSISGFLCGGEWLPWEVVLIAVLVLAILGVSTKRNR